MCVIGCADKTCFCRLGQKWRPQQNRSDNVDVCNVKYGREGCYTISCTCCYPSTHAQLQLGYIQPVDFRCMVLSVSHKLRHVNVINLHDMLMPFPIII